MKRIFAGLAVFVLAVALQAADQPTVLIYTRNGPTLDGKKGFVHDNIATCVAALQKLGQENSFAAEVSDNPAVFTNGPLKRFKAIVFANSNNKAFEDEDEKKAFQDYIRGGGGFVGIHSASGSERDWPWFWQLLGGSFWFHPPLQKFPIYIMETNHPSTSFLAGQETWAWEDEFYIMKNMTDDLKVVLAGNPKALKVAGAQGKNIAELSERTPLAWYHEFEGGRSFYTALGHKKEYYADETFLKHLLGGIKWAMKAE